MSVATSDDLRRLRREAHEHLDKWWKRVPANRRGQMRYGVYKWLSRMTGLPRDDCHISMMDRGMCEVVIELCKQAEIGLIEPPRFPNGIKMGQMFDKKRIAREASRR